MASAAPTAPEIGSNEQFHRYFQDQVTDIQAEIETLSSKSLAANERTAKSVKSLSERLQIARSSFAPRQKFSFKNRKPDASLPIKDVGVGPSQQRPQLPNSEANPTLKMALERVKPEGDAATEKILVAVNGKIRDNQNGARHGSDFAGAETILLFDQKGAHITLPKEASHASSSGSLHNIQDCVIDMSSPTVTSRPFSNLKLRDISSSIIICGRVQGDIHMTNLENSVIVTTCQQLRMHDSSNVQVYLECSSRAVIEACKNIGFAPLPSNMKSLLSPLTKGKTDTWDIKVDDFDRPVAGLSPNWSIMPENLRPEDKIWAKILLAQGDLVAAKLLVNFFSSKSEERST